jgi:hypothetical protein
MSGKPGAKYITAGKLIELLSSVDPGTKVVPNDHYNLALYAPDGFPDKYIGVIDVLSENIQIR